jgi:hypothetical protein
MGFSMSGTPMTLSLQQIYFGHAYGLQHVGTSMTLGATFSNSTIKCSFSFTSASSMYQHLQRLNQDMLCFNLILLLPFAFAFTFTFAFAFAFALLSLLCFTMNCFDLP